MDPDDSDSVFYMSIINIFIKYYNMTNETNINLFQNIDYYEDINDIIASFFKHISEFKSATDIEKKIFSVQEIDDDDFDNLFGLHLFTFQTPVFYTFKFFVLKT